MPKEETLNAITENEIISGINLIIRNATNLIEDADCLFNNERFQRAFTLYQLASEELGKSQLLFTLLLKLKSKSMIDYKPLNKVFFDHPAKSKESILIEQDFLVLMYINTPKEDIEKRKELKEYYKILQQEESQINLLNAAKNDSLYVGVKKGKFISPKEIIGEKSAAGLKTTVQFRLEILNFILRNLLSEIDTIIGSEYYKELNVENFKYNPDILELMA